MKLTLPLKLGILVTVLFAVVVGVCLSWTPLKIKYYTAKLGKKVGRGIFHFYIFVINAEMISATIPR